MLLVLVILATLAAIVIPKMAGRSQQAKVTAAASQIASIEIALDSFEVDNGYYPEERRPQRSARPARQRAQLERPVPQERHPARSLGQSLRVRVSRQAQPNGYDLMSPGPDGRAGNDDDITNWDNK